MLGEGFVPGDFVVPLRLETSLFTLVPLGPEHNAADHEAWSSSIAHIRGTPGFEGRSWPRAMTPGDNLRDLARHAGDFRRRAGFTYSVLEPSDGNVVGCVYIYPDPGEPGGARARSWVRASRAELDVPLWRTVRDWLAADWPFAHVDYAARD